MLHKSIALALCLFIPSWGAVTLDTQAAAQGATGTTSYGASITIASGHSNLCLVVLAALQDTGSVDYTSVSGGGATWSSFATGSGLGNFKGSIWQGLSPSAGATTIVINNNGNGTTTPTGVQGFIVYSLYNCNTTTPLAGSVFTTSGNQVINVTSGDMALSGQFDSNNNRTVTGCTTTTDTTGFTQIGWSGAHCTSSPTSTFTWSAFNASGSIADGVDVQHVSAGGGAAGFNKMKKLEKCEEL